MVFYRETELLSETDDLIEIRKSRQYAPPGTYDSVIIIPRSGSRKIPATELHDRSILANRGTTLKIFINGVDSGELLSPQHLIQYARLCFKVNRDSRNHPILAVDGIKAKLTDFGRLKCFGRFLKRNLKDTEYESII